jgi:hypothetical protein
MVPGIVEVPKQEMNNEELFVIGNPSVLAYVLAYLAETGNSAPCSILVVQSGPDASEETEYSQLISDLGHNLVVWENIRHTTFERVHLLPSYVYFGLTTEVLGQVRSGSIVAHADCLRNGNFFHPSLISRISEIVNYGVELHEVALDATRILQGILRTPTVVPFERLEEAWETIRLKLQFEQNSLAFREDDFLVCERYWGQDWYHLRPEADLVAYLDNVFGELKGIRRMIFRPHPWNGGQLPWQEICHQIAREREIEFETWEGHTLSLYIPSPLDHPEALVCTGGMDALGAVFAFDSSLSLAFGLRRQATRILWPDSANLEDIFQDHRLLEIVCEQSVWMRRAIKLHTSEKMDHPTNPVRVSTSGAGLFSVIADLHLQNYDHWLFHEKIHREKVENAFDTSQEDRDKAIASSKLLEAELGQVLVTAQGLETELQRLYESRSWRYLGPFRRFRHLVEKLRF